ncbi:MAG: Gfo/Idh/MocA family oxidoreductase [Verrucomicrobiota bacterium]
MSQTTRRHFLKTSAAASALAGTSTLNVLGAKSKGANGKLNVALIGGGGIAKTCFHECDDHNVVAIADVDDVRGTEAFKRFPDAKRFRDFRQLLDAHWKELDLAIVSTPDHTHFPATLAAMERNIAVHTQKPLTHNIWQARTLQKAQQKYDVQTVMGNQGHTLEGMRYIREWYEAGMIGEVREVHAWTNRTTKNNYNAKNPLPAEEIPASLDWDLWTGSAVLKNYNSRICPGGWRWWWDYGLGGLGDIGCHTLDIPKYALGLGYPSAVYMDNSLDFRHEFTGGEKNRRKKDNEHGATYVYEFPARGKRPPVKVYWYEGGHLPKMAESVQSISKIEGGGCLLVGDKNTIVSPGMRPNSPRLQDNWMELRRTIPPKTIPRAVGGPVKEIIAAVKGEIEKPGSNFDYAVPLTEVVILGTIAIRSGKKVEYSADTMSFSDSSLDAYIKEPVRKGWEYGEGLWSA